MIQKLVRRNFSLYMRDKGSVFFSLLSVLLVVVLYMLFLAKFQIDALVAQVGQAVGKEDISALVNTWIMAGLLSIVTITSPLGALVPIVQDREKGIMKDFHCGPMHPFCYPVACIVSGAAVGFVMGLLSMFVYSGYLFAVTGTTFTLVQFGQGAALLLYASLFGSCVMGAMVSFFRTTGVFSSASTVVGTVIGFVNGVYVPLGSLPAAGAFLLKVLPFGQLAMLFRQVFMAGPISLVFAQAGSTAKAAYMETYGVVFQLGGTQVRPWMAVLYTGVVAMFCLGVFFFNYQKQVYRGR